MSKQIQRLTGMHDVLSDDRHYWDIVIATAGNVARRHGFQRIDTPIIEATELFSRGVGEGSDFFVQKEMYTIDEADGSSITLRPEFTAGLVRAYIQNGMASWPQPVKLYTIGPGFRRERPQAGRLRQHSQFDCEIMGEDDPAADVEVMMVAMNLLRELGFKGLTFQVNSTGCRVCKPGYIKKLVAYLENHLGRLSDIDKTRLAKNPLRVLDSKAPGMDELLADAPHIIDHLCDDCREHFADVRALLEALGQSYAINFRLVRGIDYYTKTVFEVWQEGIGAQAALLGGGRYDGLAEDIGGPSTPSVGFGAGIERVILGMREQGLEPPPFEPLPVLVAHFGGATKPAAVKLAFELRQAGIGTRLAFSRRGRSMKSQMREANHHGARYVLIVGDDELAKGEVTVRPLADGEEQMRVSMGQVTAWLEARL
ncbi:MAG: histidine--tRNA ligase [Candidatus Promineofilum sp.]|nr:histidine--tRNA ligase [Promineifilum sp.]MBP9657565.1 histidine--tRNA ligase [Promineifilum sp.]